MVTLPTTEDDRTGSFPIKQHLPVLSNLVLVLARAFQIVWIDIFQPNEDAFHASAPGFVNEVRNAMTGSVHLNTALEINLSDLAQIN